MTKSPNGLLSKAIEESADFYRANISLEWAIELYAMAIGYSDDEAVKLKIWEKINSSRQKLIDFKSQGKAVSESKYLLEKNWEKKLGGKINQWEDYAPYFYTKEIKTTF